MKKTLIKYTLFSLSPLILVVVSGILLTASNAGVSQTVHAAPSLTVNSASATIPIPTQMAPSNWPMIPSGLGAGDSFRLIFVSTGTTVGTSNAVSHYNSLVQTDARRDPEFKENMALLFRALVSVYQGIDARGNTLTRHLGDTPDAGHSSPIYWVKGNKVADNYADFYDGSWDSGELRDYSGVAIATTTYTGGYVWTGSKSDGTPANTNTGWSIALGSPQAWWSFGMRYGAYGRANSSGNEIYLGWGETKHASPIYALSPLFTIRSATGPKPSIIGPSEQVRVPFDVTVEFPEDDKINGMDIGDFQVNGGTASNLRGSGASYTATITPTYAESVYDPTTVSVTIKAGAVTDVNGWSSVTSNPYTVSAAYMDKLDRPIAFDSEGVGTVPRSWAFIPSAELEPGDSFRLLFVTSDTRNAESSNIDDYNRFVQNAAARNTHLTDFSDRFRVLASTQNVHAIDNTGTRGTGVPIYWLGGARAAANYPDLWDNSWESRAGTDEQGKWLRSSTEIWTGTRVWDRRIGTGEHYSELGNIYSWALATRLSSIWSYYSWGTSTTYKAHYYTLSPVLIIEGGAPTPTPTPEPTATPTPESTPTPTPTPEPTPEPTATPTPESTPTPTPTPELTPEPTATPTPESTPTPTPTPEPTPEPTATPTPESTPTPTPTPEPTPEPTATPTPESTPTRTPTPEPTPTPTPEPREDSNTPVDQTIGSEPSSDILKPTDEDICRYEAGEEDGEINEGLEWDCLALLDIKDDLASEDIFNWGEPLVSMSEWDGVTLGGTPTRVTQLNLNGRAYEGSKMDGIIPARISEIGELTHLYLNYNQLTGSIPTELGLLSHLQGLQLDSNLLTGEIPASLGNLSSLTHLGISSNRLTGSIPVELGKLTNLTQLWLNSNNLTGDIPSEIGDLPDLKYLKLEQNDFTGCIPESIRQRHLMHVGHDELSADLGLPWCDEVEAQPTATPTPEPEPTATPTTEPTPTPTTEPEPTATPMPEPTPTPTTEPEPTPTPTPEPTPTPTTEPEPTATPMPEPTPTPTPEPTPTPTTEPTPTPTPGSS